MIAYASRSLTASERQYSVIQRECLAVVYALKQFSPLPAGTPIPTCHRSCSSPVVVSSEDGRHAMLLGASHTEIRFPDWHSRYTMLMMLSLVFTPHHVLLLWPCLTTRRQPSVSPSKKTAGFPRSSKPTCTLVTLLRDRSGISTPCNGTHNCGLSSGRLMEYSAGTIHPAPWVGIVPILPAALRQEALRRNNHDEPTAGHQGVEKTLDRLQQEVYWVSMARDVEQYCREYTKCQQSKLSMPQRAPLTSLPIGRPWQMVAVDILEVPLSTNNNRYLLVVQDYYTKWAEAVPLPDQTAARITGELIKVFSIFGHPEILHSDQGRNFESSILAQTLEAFGVHKSRTTPYHP